MKHLELYGELKKSEKNLRKLETDYKQEETKFIEMVEDYNIQIGKTQEHNENDEALNTLSSDRI